MTNNDSISKILTIVLELQLAVKKLQSNNEKLALKFEKANFDKMNEVAETTYQLSEDICKKMDLMLNVGVKKPKLVPGKKEVSNETSVETISKKKSCVENRPVKGGRDIIKNILTYFKVRYNENINIFDNILEENQAKTLFEEHAEAINAKKNDVEKQKERTNLLYKNLTAPQKKKVREMMIEENEASAVNNADDIETE
jgi:hypothetical protein